MRLLVIPRETDTTIRLAMWVTTVNWLLFGVCAALGGAVLGIVYADAGHELPFALFGWELLFALAGAYTAIWKRILDSTILQRQLRTTISRSYKIN